MAADFYLRPGRVNDDPKAYVAQDGRILCDQANKRCYYRREDAEAAMAVFNNSGLRAYQHQCGFWHFGHVIAR